jgi:hypothetical protein
MSNADETWYVVKQPDGHCAVTAQPPAAPQASNPDNLMVWGPFASQSEAIARRVGLIRAGKCQPV